MSQPCFKTVKIDLSLVASKRNILNPFEKVCFVFVCFVLFFLQPGTLNQLITQLIICSSLRPREEQMEQKGHSSEGSLFRRVIIRNRALGLLFRMEYKALYSSVFLYSSSHKNTQHVRVDRPNHVRRLVGLGD